MTGFLFLFFYFFYFFCGSMGLWQHMILIKWFGIISLADFFFLSYFIML